EKTVESFRRVAMPRLATVVRPPASASAAPPSSAAVTKAVPAVPKSMPSPGAPAPPAATVRDLSFVVAAAPWKGDLGLFVRDHVREGDARVRIWVRGGG